MIRNTRFYLMRKSRERKYHEFLSFTKPYENCTLLDVGVADREYSPADNYLEKKYPWPHKKPRYVPATHDFEVWRQLTGTGRGRQLLQVIERAVKQFPVYGYRFTVCVYVRSVSFRRPSSAILRPAKGGTTNRVP